MNKRQPQPAGKRASLRDALFGVSSASSPMDKKSGGLLRCRLGTAADRLILLLLLGAVCLFVLWPMACILLRSLGEKGKSRTADELVELTQIPARRVLSALTMLQVDGAVQEHPGRRFSALVELEE